MLRRKQEINQQIQQIIDAVLLVLAFWGSYALRVESTGWFNLDVQIPPFKEFLWMIVVIMPCGPLMLELQGFYEHPLQKQMGRTLSQLGRALVGLALLVGLCVMFLRVALPSRSVLILFVLIGVGLLLIKDRILLAYARRLAARGLLREPVLLAGLPEDMDQLMGSLTSEQLIHIEVVERIDIERQPIADLVEALHRHAISRVIFSAAHSHLLTIQAAIYACETEGVEAWLVADFVKTAIARPTFETIGDRPMLVFRSTPDASWSLLGKRAIDLTGAILGLTLFSWLFVLVALSIKLTSPGRSFSVRCAADGTGGPFRCSSSAA